MKVFLVIVLICAVCVALYVNKFYDKELENLLSLASMEREKLQKDTFNSDLLQRKYDPKDRKLMLALQEQTQEIDKLMEKFLSMQNIARGCRIKMASEWLKFYQHATGVSAHLFFPHEYDEVKTPAMVLSDGNHLIKSLKQYVG